MLTTLCVSQIISLPDLRIVDYSYGFTGSTHDSTAFERTKMAQEHEEILEPHEWIWADSAYPVCLYFVLICYIDNLT